MLTDSGSDGGPLGRATFQNIASRLHETPTFEKNRVSPRQSPYFRSGRPSLSPAQAQWAKKSFKMPRLLSFFFDLQNCTSCDGVRWTPMGTQAIEEATFFDVFSIFDGKTHENSMFFHTLGACGHSHPSLNKRKGADGHRF
jgi:hypothetical protein